MNIISQFNKILEKNLKVHFNTFLHNAFVAFKNPYCIDSYKQFVEEFDNFTTNFTIDAYQSFILALDQQFMKSKIRKELYTSKGFVTKPLLTKFGIVKFKRRRYVDKDGKSFMFADRLLGLTKYSRLDPFVIADLVEEAASNSYAKAGRIVSKQIGKKIKYENDFNKYILNRATTRNNVIKASLKMTEPTNDELTIKEVLNVMLD